MPQPSRGRLALVLSLAAAFGVSSAVFTHVTSEPSRAETTGLRTVRVAPDDDAFGTSVDPDGRRGHWGRLVVRKGDGIRKTSYLKFHVTQAQLDGGAITRAFLVVRLRRELRVPVTVHSVRQNGWTEQHLTYRSAPRVGGVVGRMAPGPNPLRWVSVSDVVTAPGTYSFALTTTRGVARFASAETHRAPALVLKVRAPRKGATTPTASPSTTPSPTATTAPDPGTSSPVADPTPPTTAEPTGDPGTPTACTQRFPGDPCDGRMFYGASVEGGDPRPLEDQLGRRLTLFRSYMSASTPASRFATRAAADVAAGRVPLISTKLPGSWASVAAGDHDGWLLDRIRALAAVDGPVWLTLHHEPRSDGPPADWVDMQQHARTLIDANSDNIALVGILNGWDFLERGGNPEAYRHPVGTGVDVMGFDSYNPWSPTNGKEWKSVETAMSPGLVIQSWGYPTLIGETGVRTDPDNPGRAARWLADLYDFTTSHGFVGVSYFDSGANSPDGTWDLTGERLEQYGRNLARPETAQLAG